MIFDAAIAAEAAVTADELIDALEPAFALIGLSYFRVVEAVSDGEARVLRHMVGKVNSKWERFYSEQRFAQRDPRLRWALTSSAPFFMSDILAELRCEERVTVEEARRFGIFQSFVLPHRGADNRRFAVVAIGTLREITPLERVAAHTLGSALLFSSLRIEGQGRSGAAREHPALTIRQLQCLEWSRRGKSSADIGKILGLSPRTIDEHFAMACRVLEVRTRVQAVSKALALGVLPYLAADVPKMQRNP